jgi:dTDP-3-amino-3,4,6-trideoxy-alpha-D-glucopyranose N,N-dimethyltransferase/N-dimethyltransferase
LFSAAIDYEKEVEFYDKILNKHHCKKILEVGCGCGNRGKYFVNRKYDYVGSDISDSMLRIARKKYPGLEFIHSDARNLKLRRKFDAILFLGKGSAYLTTDDDVMSALKSMKRLINKGLIIIDGFNADFIIPNFKKNISWSIKTGNKTITRSSINVLKPNTNIWKRELCYIVQEDKAKKTFHDKAILRAFAESEFKSFFTKAGIKNTEFIINGDTIISIGIM